MQPIKLGATGTILRFILTHNETGQGITGLAHNSAGLIISTITDNEAAATSYRQADGNIETIAALGTYAAPTANKCRFKEVDAGDHPGLYEIQLANARFDVEDARVLIVSVSGAANLVTADYQVSLVGYDPYLGGGFIVAPLQASITNGIIAPETIILYVGTDEPHVTWAITDGEGDPVDLEALGATVTLVVKRQDGTTYFSLTSADGGITLDSNQVTEQRTAAQIAVKGSYTYELRRTDAGHNTVLRSGPMEIQDPPT